jgi:tetratricopeptide (TPR) repeat protein
MIDLAGAETTVIVVSDDGFHSDHLLRIKPPKEPAGPARQHRSYGIIVANGEGIRKDELIFGASLLDVTPTILTLLGLPVGEDMDGKALVQIFDTEIRPQYISSWEELPGADGRHPDDLYIDPMAEQQALEQLIALGYVEKPEANKAAAVERTVNESQYFLARALMDKHDDTAALIILEELHEKDPEVTRFMFMLARCYQNLGQIAKCRFVVEEISIQVSENNPRLNLLQGSLALAEKRYKKALEYFHRAEAGGSVMPGLYQQIGKAYLALNQLNDAERAFGKALDLDPENHIVFYGLAQLELHRHNFKKALKHGLTSVGLIYNYPDAHYTVSKAFQGMGDHAHGAEALEITLSMAPNFIQVRQDLIKLYRQHLDQPDRAMEHQVIIDQIRANTRK